MEYGAGTAELQTRVKRLEDQLKAFRFVFVIVSLAWASLIWLQARPKAILTATIVEARQFNVVDEAGKTVAELSRKNGRAHLILYDASYKPVGEFSVVGSDPSIVFYDGEHRQRAILGMFGGAPTLAMHDTKGDTRALLTADENNSMFWVKDKNGSATIIGNAIDEARKVQKINGKDVPHDTVATASGASIRIQDAKRTVVWKAP